MLPACLGMGPDGTNASRRVPVNWRSICCPLLRAWTAALGATDMELRVTVFADLVLEGGGVKGIALVGAIS
jgi:predicted acylesterase/phospholipase RssA